MSEKNVNDLETRIQQAIRRHLEETLGIYPEFSDCSEASALPHVIRSAYSIGKIRLLGDSFVTLTASDDTEWSPAGVAKHLAWIAERFHQRALFVAATIESFNRKRLIEHKVPFIVPGNQLYLPDLGLDLREYMRKVRQKRSKLSPSAQLVFLAHLLRKPGIGSWTATGLAEVFAATKMTMSRAIDDLESHDLLEVRPEWREKQVHFAADRKQLWEKAFPHLRSPVQNRIYVEHLEWPLGSIAGLSALSELTMIAAPDRLVRAVTSEEWKALQIDTGLRIIPTASAKAAPVELEIWRYDPRILSQSGMVDPLSLYLSLAEEKDERVEAERERLLEDFAW